MGNSHEARPLFFIGFLGLCKCLQGSGSNAHPSTPSTVHPNNRRFVNPITCAYQQPAAFRHAESLPYQHAPPSPDRYSSADSYPGAYRNWA